jgi:hypothetical protein
MIMSLAVSLSSRSCQYPTVTVSTQGFSYLEHMYTPWQGLLASNGLCTSLGCLQKIFYKNPLPHLMPTTQLRKLTTKNNTQ